ncbi:MAG: thermosome subunit alpha [Nanoarchaeota archaeon]
MAKDQDILPEDTRRTVGRSAQRNNILAAKLVAETVRTTLGPKGMDKMLVNQLGDVTVTNDGATILEEIAIEHPAAKMIVEIAKTQEDEVGDGTTTAVIIAGELLKNAEHLLDKNIHPTVITRGYRLAAQKATESLKAIAEPVSTDDKDVLAKIAQTAITGKSAELSKETLGRLAVEAAVHIFTATDQPELHHIRIETQPGTSVDNSRLIEGLIIDKARTHSGMPKKIEDAKILLYNAPIEVRDTETDAKISITSPDQMDAFLKQEENMIKALAQKIIDTGANVVFCQKGIDDLAQYFLAKHGIMAMRRVKKTDMDALSASTGARIISNLDEITTADLGSAQCVEEMRVDEEFYTYVTGCRKKDIVTLLLHGGTEHTVAEIKRGMEDALGDLFTSLRTKRVVGGAGAPEIETAKVLRAYAESLPGREQLAVAAFAEAIESIPVTLAENAGLDPIDILTGLKAAHENKQVWAGVDVFSGEIIDSWKQGIIEPLKVKTQAIESASEVAIMVLRIDDVIAATSQEAPGNPQMPGDF